VKGISREEEAAFAHNKDLAAAMEDARRALNVQGLMLKAQRRGDWGEVLEQSTVLASLVPKYAQGVELREKAASALEREADTSAAGGNYEGALARLETLRRNYPDRRGLADRIERIRADQAADKQLGQVLAGAEQAELDQIPEQGLAALAAAAPGPRWEVRFQQAHERLTQQLDRLDAASPTVALTPEVKLEYKKGEPGTISVRIQDDHGVKSARLFAGPREACSTPSCRCVDPAPLRRSDLRELPPEPDGHSVVASITRPHDSNGQRPEASQARARRSLRGDRIRPRANMVIPIPP
jgi:tetratricopeptide (TPR) repeat protein